MLSAEDDLETTVVPRLIAAGADLSKVHTLPKLDTIEDIDRLQYAIMILKDVRLVVIDPITAYTGKIDDYKNNVVRALLKPLASLAARYEIAIVLVTHLNKGESQKSLNRIMGSIAYTAAARSVWMIVADPNEPLRRLFVPVKCNLAPEPKGLAFRIEGDPPRVVWDATDLDIHADDVLATSRREKRPDRRNEAAEWLKTFLADGPKPSLDVIEKGNIALKLKRKLKWWRDSVFKARLGGTPAKRRSLKAAGSGNCLPKRPKKSKTPKKPKSPKKSKGPATAHL